MPTIFEKIVAGDMPADILYQDDQVTAFRDIHPVAPTHVLIVPNEVIPTANDLEPYHDEMAGRLMRVASQIAADEGIADDGYRLILNCNEHGGQEVFHLHLHLIGGRPLGPMVTGS